MALKRRLSAESIVKAESDLYFSLRVAPIFSK